RLQEASDGVQECGLAAAGGTDNRDELARIDVDLGVADRLDRSLDGLVAQREILHFDMALRRARPAPAFRLPLNLAHVGLQGMTSCPAPRIKRLDPRPRTPIAIMPSAMSAYWTSE